MNEDYHDPVVRVALAIFSTKQWRTANYVNSQYKLLVQCKIWHHNPCCLSQNLKSDRIPFPRTYMAYLASSIIGSVLDSFMLALC